MVSFWKQYRNLFAVIFGLLASNIMVMAMEVIGHSLYPPPAKLDYKNPEQIQSYLATAPAMVHVMVILAYFVGAIAVGFFSYGLSSKKTMLPFYIATGLFLGLTVVNFIMLPFHPIWMIIASVIMILLGAWIGLKIVHRYGHQIFKS